MSENISKWTQNIHVGDVRDRLADLPSDAVHCVMTSPPYFGLRDYGEDGQIGLEDSLDEYISELVAVFDELRRVVREDGSVWLNLGDSYAQSGRSNHDKSGTAPDGQGHERGHDAGMFGPKNKMLVPHRVAIALQEAGWVVRNDVTWVKPNPMPSPVKDRLNTTTEQVFHLTPAPDYWYDLDAIREPHAESTHERDKYGSRTNDEWVEGQDDNHNASGHSGMNPAGKNPGDVFQVTTKPFADAHFAVYPPELCEKPLKATCPPTVCAECGTPYERETSRETAYDHNTTTETGLDHDRNDTDGGDGHDLRNSVYSEATFDGWSKPCDCDTDETQPGVALDPFAGAGTTCLVAKRLGRRFIGVDLNPDYVALAQRRVGVTVDEPHRLPETDEETVSLAAFTDGGTTDE